MIESTDRKNAASAEVMPMQIPIVCIIVPKGRRPLDPAKVEEIAASIKAIGLLSPIGTIAVTAARFERKGEHHDHRTRD
jgi:hypothetical protein